MPEQTIQLLASWYGSVKSWVPPDGSRPTINADLRGSGERFFGLVRARPAGSFTVRFTSDQLEVSSPPGDDLTTEFETNGSIELIVGSNSLLVALAGADMLEPYDWTPSNSAEVTAFVALLSDTPGTESGQLIIRDFVPVRKTYLGSTPVDKLYIPEEVLKIYVGDVQVL